MSRICWRITLCCEGLSGEPSNATADVLITRRNDAAASGLYQQLCFTPDRTTTTYPAWVDTTSHHDRHHDLD
jgi:hypothetical protein